MVILLTIGALIMGETTAPGVSVYFGDCFLTHTYYPKNTSCATCDDGSGSGACLSSWQTQYDPSKLVKECVDAGSKPGQVHCHATNLVSVGIKFECGDKGVTFWGVFDCAVMAGGTLGAAIFAALASDGAAAGWLVAEASSGLAGISACRWCKVHHCGTYPGDDGTEITKTTTAVLSGDTCNDLIAQIPKSDERDAQTTAGSAVFGLRASFELRSLGLVSQAGGL